MQLHFDGNRAVFVAPSAAPSSLDSFDQALNTAFTAFAGQQFVMHYDIRPLHSWFTLFNLRVIWEAARVLAKNQAKTRALVSEIEIRADAATVRTMQRAISVVEKVYTIRKKITYIEE